MMEGHVPELCGTVPDPASGSQIGGLSILTHHEEGPHGQWVSPWILSSELRLPGQGYPSAEECPPASRAAGDSD